MDTREAEYGEEHGTEKEDNDATASDKHLRKVKWQELKCVAEQERRKK